MKKQIYFGLIITSKVFLLSFLIINVSYSQEEPVELWLGKTNEDAMPGDQTTETNDAGLNQALSSYNVTQFAPLFKGTTVEPFDQLFFIRCDCDLEALETHIEQNFIPALINGVDVQYPIDTNIVENSTPPEYNPEDKFWQESSTDKLWHPTRSRLNMRGI